MSDSVVCQRQLPKSALPDALVDMAMPDSEIYRALLGLSRSLAGHSDLGTLCNSLAESLRSVVSFDFLALVLYDRVHDELRLHSVSANRSYKERPAAFPAEGDHIGARAWREQKPVIIPTLRDVAAENSFTAEALEEGIEALILIPLSNGDHRLGVLAFGFTSPFQPDAGALAFLERVASEAAVSVEGYLTRQALVLERDRMRVLFDITNALISKLPLDELFAAISEQLSRVVSHDFAAMAALDKDTGEIRLTTLHSSHPLPRDPSSDAEKTINLEGTPFGEALATGKPVTTSRIDFERFPSPVYRRYLEGGVRASCSIPLVGANGVFGLLEIGRTADQPFTEAEVDLLVQVGRQIAIAMENALAYRELGRIKDQLATEKLYLEEEIRLDQNLGNMIGESPAFQAVRRAIQVVAPTDATVLIEGETGTGKELVARAIHDLSGRARRSFIKVNCAAIPATLLESELFGHEKGSFTGAFAQKIGRFELAHEGTLFLDEIGEIPVELQSKLLRAIQEQELERLGGNRTIHVNVRFVAATNRNLKQMVDEGKFRSDLYYRLHVFPLIVPPLRERKEDVPLLIRYFTQKYAKRMNRPIEEIPSPAVETLSRYDWPGNIRELQNVIERSVILSPGRLLQIALPETAKSSPLLMRSPRLEEASERERILRALAASGGKVAGADGAAARLGLRRTTLQSRMKKLHIERQYR